MKKILLTVLTAVILTAVIIGSSVLYKELTAEFEGNNLVTDQSAINSQLGGQKPTNDANTNDANVSSPSEDVSGDNTENTPPSENESLNENENGDGNEAPPSDNDSQNSSPETEKEEEKTDPPKNLAPDFTVLDENGNEVKLSDFRGKPVVLNFWATWCYYCKVEMPDFNEAFKKYPDVHFLMVNATSTSGETESKAKSFKSDNGYAFNIYFDKTGEATDTYNITGYPTTYFISAEGELIAVGNGMLSMSNLEYGVSLILPAKKED